MIPRGPLPPTPSDDPAPVPPPHSSRAHGGGYHQTHGPNPNTIQSYEHNEIKQNNRKGPGGGAGSSIDERGAEPLPPPVPVSMYCNVFVCEHVLHVLYARYDRVIMCMSVLSLNRHDR